MKASVSAGVAPVQCPLCYALDLDAEAFASVGRDEFKGQSGPFLDGFECPMGHRLKDLGPSHEGDVLISAVEWLARGVEAFHDYPDREEF